MAITLSLTNCKTNNDVVINNTKSIADNIAGLYSGTGKNMPNGILLGTYKGCVTPSGWESNLKTGASFVNISKVNDSIVNITFSGGPFSNDIYSNFKVKQNGNLISFTSKYSSVYFDVNSKFLSISMTTGSYTITNSCLQGLPYYVGEQDFIDLSTYIYITVGHIDFSGTKQ